MATATWFVASNVTPADPNSLQEVLPENEAYTGLVTGDMCFVIVNELNLRIYRYNEASTETDDFFQTTVIPTLNVSGTGAWEEQRTTGLMTAFQGSFANQFDALVTESGGTISLDFEATGGIPALGIFPDDLIAVPIQSIVLTPGDDDDPQENFVYVLESDPTALDLSTSGWPAGFHIKVAYILCPTAAYVADNGVYINQNWNDGNHPTGMGHLTGVGENIRLTQSGAVYHDGIDANGATSGYITIDTGDTPDSIYFLSSSGSVYQMHKHTVPAYDTGNGSEILVVNSSVAVYNAIKDISDEQDDSNGDPLTNKYYNVVMMGVGNKSGEYSPLLMNLPSGSYNTESGALRDTEGYDNYGIPAAFSRQSATGFLICRITFRNQSGNLSVIETVDLRGQTPGTASGSTAYAGTDFSDDLFTLFDADDITRILDFNLSNITGGNTRTILPADADMTLFTTGQYTDLTNGGESTLHYHNALKDSGEVGVLYANGGAAQLNYDGTKTLVTASSSILVYNSNGSAYSQYLHDGTDVIISNSVNSGWLKLKANNSGGNPVDLITADPDGDIVLFNNGIKSLKTKSDGIALFDTDGAEPHIKFYDSDSAISADIFHTGVYLQIDDSRNAGAIWMTAKTTGGTQTWVGFDPDTAAFYCSANKALDLGRSGTAWDDVWADDYENVADFYWMDFRKDKDGNIVEVDDMQVIENILPSDNYDPISGLRLINDSTLPTWLVKKHKRAGERRDENGDIVQTWEVGDVAVTPEGRPFLSLKTMISLLMGSVRQLRNRLRNHTARISALEDAAKGPN